MIRHNPLYNLIGARVRQFFREPEAIFWTYGFPLLMVLGLGIAFRTKPPELTAVGVQTGPGSAALVESLTAAGTFDVHEVAPDQAAEALRRGRIAVMVSVDGQALAYEFDPTHPEGRPARLAVDDCLQRVAGRADAVVAADSEVTVPGSRYVDFLVPGLIGMNLMGGGLWGIGFVLVDMRVRNLLKRLVATPMRRRDFLLSMVVVRALFFIPEMIFLLLAAYLIFNVEVVGTPVSIVFIGFVGSMAFAGLGLLVASRARRIETVSGLMNLVMLPMWLMSGVFFSSERFPEALQPVIQMLPLTMLNNALRAVIMDGATVASQIAPLAGLSAWAAISFFFAMKLFRWN